MRKLRPRVGEVTWPVPHGHQLTEPGCQFRSSALRSRVFSCSLLGLVTHLFSYYFLSFCCRHRWCWVLEEMQNELKCGSCPQWASNSPCQKVSVTFSLARRVHEFGVRGPGFKSRHYGFGPIPFPSLLLSFFLGVIGGLNKWTKKSVPDLICCESQLDPDYKEKAGQTGAYIFCLFLRITGESWKDRARKCPSKTESGGIVWARRNKTWDSSTSRS